MTEALTKLPQASLPGPLDHSQAGSPTLEDDRTNEERGNESPESSSHNALNHIPLNRRLNLLSELDKIGESGASRELLRRITESSLVSRG